MTANWNVKCSGPAACFPKAILQIMVNYTIVMLCQERFVLPTVDLAASLEGVFLMGKAVVTKKHFVFIILLSIFLTSLEVGIFLEVLWHGWGGYGDLSMEYTAIGHLGSGFLIVSIPAGVIAIVLIRIAIGKRKIRGKEFLFRCLCALSGIGIAIGLFFYVPDSLIFEPGRRLAAFLIDYCNWMEYPIP